MKYVLYALFAVFMTGCAIHPVGPSVVVHPVPTYRAYIPLPPVYYNGYPYTPHHPQRYWHRHY